MRKPVLLMLCLLSGFMLRAQKHFGEKQAVRMKTELSLSEDQFNLLMNINARFTSDYLRLQSDTVLTRVQLRTERKKLLDAREAGIKEILTEEQLVKWAAVRKADANRTGQSNKRRNPVQEMKTIVGLSDGQAAKIMTINREMSEDFKRIRYDTATSRAGTMSARKAIMEKRNASVRKILTEEQYSRFIAYEAERTGRRELKR
jgi:hypothetical protein